MSNVSLKSGLIANTNSNNSNASLVDFKWMGFGGLLLDSSGDIAFTSSTQEVLEDMVFTRLKAAVNGWKNYNIGADLDSIPGSVPDAELEIAVKKQITVALTDQFLNASAFSVSTIVNGSSLTAYVYISNTLIATTNIQLS